MDEAVSEIDDDDRETRLLSLVREFILECKTERALAAVSMAASLDRDLGIDSLGRVELFLRIEKTFNVSFPDTLIAEADSLQDILRAMKIAAPSQPEIARQMVSQLSESRFDPSTVENLVEALVKHANTDPKRPHIYLSNEYGEETIIRYGDLLENARKVAGGLLALGLRSMDTVAIMLPTSEDFFYAFLGTLLAGGIPVPIYPPVRKDKIEEYALREATILNNAEVRILITFSQVETLARLLRVFIKSLSAVTTVTMLMASKHKVPNRVVRPEDPAMIQYTSGSTSAPKGVLLTHANLLANIRSVGKAIGITASDVGVSWLPLYHDMGLIGAWFATLYQGCPLTLMSPLTFLNRPERWLWAIHYHRGTLSAGPNFAYELCVRRIRDQDIVGLDLSSWRLAFNGSEAVSAKTLDRFTKKFEPYGFRREAFYPVYGLAECCVAVTFPPLNRQPLVDLIKREPFEHSRVAVPAEKGESTALEFVCCGEPIPNHDIRVVDENNQELPERHVGALQFTGPSAMQGYYHNSEATRAVYHDGWWDTGDFAYIANGELYITGRKKDIIIKAGRNLYPQEIEEAAGQVTGVRRGCTVAFGVEDLRLGTEKLVVIAETTETREKIRDTISSEILEKIALLVGAPPDEICLVSPRSIPKTSSGKLQRAAAKKMYLEGQLSRTGLPVWIQMMKLLLRGAGVTVLGYAEKIGRFFYTGYVAALAIFYLPVLMVSLLFPKRFARRLFQVFIRTLLFLACFRVKVVGLEYLRSNQSAIYVANHASYVDSLLLLAILPSHVLFVGKRELLTWPIVKWIVKKFEFPTVDRLDFTRNLIDAKNLLEKLQQGNSILIYPEGTFTYATGLRPFKMGAFKLAVDTEIPIIPLALQGTRNLLRARSLLLSPTKVTVTVSKPIVAEGKEWSAVTALYTKVRQEISKNCGELNLDLVAAGPER